MSDLKPCPFCGATNNKHRRNITELYDDDNYKFVKCHNCSSISYKWNSRPIEDALQTRIAELENAAIVWHKYPEEKPIDGRYLFWDSDGNAPHVLPYNDIVVRDNPGVFSTQTHWAYLPAPPKERG